MKRINSRSSWISCFIAALFFAYEMAQLAVFNTLSQHLMQAFGLSPLTLSQLSSSYLYLSAIMLLPAGLLLDRFSTKNILILTSILATLGVYLFAHAPTTFIAFLGRSLIGMGNAFAFLGSLRLAVGWFSPNRASLVIGLSVTIAMLGAVLAQTPFAYLIHLFGWRNAMTINAGIGIFITILLAWKVKNAPAQKEHNTSRRNILGSLRLAIANHQNWLCGLYTALMNLPIMLLGSLWGNMYLIHGKNYSPYTAGNLVSLIFIGIILGSAMLGWLANTKERKKNLMKISAAILALNILAIAYLNLPLIVVASLFFILGFFSGAQILTYSIVAEKNSTNLKSISLAVVSIVINGIGALAQFLFAFLVPRIDPNVSHLFHVAIWILPIAFFLSVLVAFKIKVPALDT